MGDYSEKRQLELFLQKERRAIKDNKIVHYEREKEKFNQPM